MQGKIYLIENQINHKQYIGKTYDTLETRWKEHCKDARKERCEKRPLYNAFNKYGVENFTISLVEETDNLEEREIFWIAYYDTYANGYNATRGGDGKPLYDYDLFIQDFQNGMLVQEIASKYGCDRGTVTKALHTVGIDSLKNKHIRSSHKIIQLTRQGEILNEFNSQADAARYLLEHNEANGNISSIVTNIGRVAKGQRPSAFGYLWKYV